MTNQITFRAAFPSIQSAIKITGDGGGMRIQLDIPESEMAEAVKLMLYRQIVLRITVEPDAQETPQASQTIDNRTARTGTVKRTAAKKRV